MNNKLVKTLSGLLAILILLSVSPVNVSASEYENDIHWTFDGQNLVVTGKGELSSDYTTTEEWKTIKKECVNIVVEGEIQAIGNAAFKEFAKLKTVQINGDVATLGAFSFHACPYLEIVTVNSLLRIIGDSAFADCTSLKSVQIPDTVTEIGEKAFINAVALKDFVLPSNLKRIGESAFKGSDCFDGTDLVVPFSVDYIGLGAFADANVKSLTIPFIGPDVIPEENAKYRNKNHSLGWIFGQEKFSDATRYSANDEYYYIPNTLKEVKLTKSVDYSKFTGVPIVEKITFCSTIQSTAISIGFAQNCSSLKEVCFEAGSLIEDVNSQSFKNCKSLSKVTINCNAKRISENAFENCTSLQYLKLPDTIVSIGSGAFANCSSIKNIKMPGATISIGARAFENCVNLSGVTFPKQLKSIENKAFYGCTGIEEIILPDTVTQLGDYCFAQCSALKRVVLSLNLTKMGVGVFEGTPYAENSGSGDDVVEELPEEEQMPDFVISENGELISYLGKDVEVIIPEGVTAIAEYAFKNREDIISVKLPESILRINGYSFYGCTGITELVVPDTIEYIASNAFAGMCRLEKLTVPFIGKSKHLSGEVQTDDRNIKWWFEYTQKTCSVCKGELCDSVDIPNRNYDVCKPKSFVSLTITEGNSANKILKYALKNFGVKEVALGEKVERIDEYGLAEAGIEVINFHPNIRVSEIKSYAFSENKIKSVTLPDSIKVIRDGAFAGNEISELNLNEGLEYLSGFGGNKLTSVKIPSTVKSIEYHAFWGCSLLEHVEIPEGVETICLWAFAATGIKEIVLPESITWISECAFSRSKIERIVLPESLSYISKETFEDCEFLKEVVIGGSVEEISLSAFADCSSLETVVIPDSVKAISDDAFANSTENLVIYCNEGSYAQQYAVQNNIKYTTLVLEAIPNQTYTGKAIEPEIKAKANNKQLTLEKEYKVSFADNIESGVASVTAKGLGDFKHLVAKGGFNILPRQLNDVVVSYYDFAYYTPNGVKPRLSLYLGEDKLVEGEHYEVLGLDKVKNVGVYNISISGKGNFSGTKNFTLEVLPRSITVTKIVSTGDVKVIDSQYTLVEGVDYKIENRTDETGENVSYVVGIGNYTDETALTPSNNSMETTGFLRLLEILINFFSLLFGIFK